MVILALIVWAFMILCVINLIIMTIQIIGFILGGIIYSIKYGSIIKGFKKSSEFMN